MLHGNLCCNANLLLIKERYFGREEDLDESFNYFVSRPDGEWVEYTDAANAVVNAVNLEYNDWSGDAAAKTEKDPNSRYKHLKYVESSVVIHCYVYRRRFFDLSFITS